MTRLDLVKHILDIFRHAYISASMCETMLNFFTIMSRSYMRHFCTE